jgi:Mitochondrial carrier protein
MRESLYAAGYLGVMPLLRSTLQEVTVVNDVPGGPLILSGIAAGLLATVSTQPADTIKTRMQAFPDPTLHPEYRSMLSTTKHIVTTEGVGTLFAGLLPRAFRIVCAVFILTGTRNTIIDLVETDRWKSSMEKSHSAQR